MRLLIVFFFTLLVPVACENSLREFLYVGTEPPDYSPPNPGGDNNPSDPTDPPPPDLPSPIIEVVDPPDNFIPASNLVISAAESNPLLLKVQYNPGGNTPSYAGVMLFEDGKPLGFIHRRGDSTTRPTHTTIYPEPREPGTHVYVAHQTDTEGRYYPGTNEFTYTVPATTSIRWDAPTTNVDGSPLTDLDRYDIFVNGVNVEFSKTTEATLGFLKDGDRVTVRAVDTSGNASDESNVLIITGG